MFGSASGMGMLLKQMGIDPEQIKTSIEAFMYTTKAAVEEIRTNQKEIMDALKYKADKEDVNQIRLDVSEVESKMKRFLPVEVHAPLPDGSVETTDRFPDVIYEMKCAGENGMPISNSIE